MTIINIHYISRLLDPLFSLDDVEIDDLSTINFNDELTTKVFFEQRLHDNFKKYGVISQEMCKNALEYVLCIPGHPYTFPDLFPYGELPVEAPDDINLFFSWLWQVLFPGEIVKSCTIDDFVI